MKQLFVEILYPGILFSEPSTVEIDDVTKAYSVFKASYDKAKKEKRYTPFAYRTFTKTIATVDGEILVGKPKNYSPWFYLGEKLSLEHVKRDHPDKYILIANMENNEIKFVCRTESGQFIPMEDGDILL